MKFPTQFNRLNKRPVLIQIEPSLTDQSYKEECDINFILNQYVSRGEPLPPPPESYVDLVDQNASGDYIEALQLVAEHRNNFSLLPAKEQERFGYNVSNYLEFISNPKNLKESYEKRYIDPSSVDLRDIYPERYQNVSINLQPPSGASQTLQKEQMPQTVVNTES